MKKIDFESLKFLMKENKDRKVALTFHSIGDTDSIASAIALSAYFPNSKVIMPDLITYNSTRIMRRLGFKPENVRNAFEDSAETIILLDVNNLEDCGSFRYRLEEFKGNVIVIDHHAPKDIQGDNFSVFNDEGYNSASSIVYKLLCSLKASLDKNTSLLLLAGIISDSADLKNSTSETFMQMGELMAIAGTDYSTIMDYMQHVSDPQSRASTLNDVAKATTDIINDTALFLHGKAHAHANIAADMAIRAGADLALFYTETEKEVSISVRLRSPLDKQYHIHLGLMMKSMAKMINGTGGGHPCAAGAYGPATTNLSNLENVFIEEMRKKFGKAY
ncbi:MAG: DHH family phosphoesterase [Candidatus Marsarchaeota archaeon]|nr:DHH family phosphoesterase [Candidatus Marsarchaeota archaeon]